MIKIGATAADSQQRGQIETNFAGDILNSNSDDAGRLPSLKSMPVVLQAGPSKTLSDYVIQPLANAGIAVCISILSAIVTIAFFFQNIGSSHSPEIRQPLSDNDFYRAKEVIDNLANKIKGEAGDHLYREIPEKIRSTLCALGFKDDSGYRSPLFSQFEEKLIKTVCEDHQYVNSFIDKITNNMLQNSYFLSAVAEIIKDAELDAISEHESYIMQNIPEWIAMAITLDALTEAQAKDVDLLEACMNTWDDDRRRQGGLLKSLDFSATIKLLSVDKPVKDAMRYRRNGQVDRNFTRNMLPFNIIEAVVYDIFHGNFDNAAAGLVLAKNYPGKCSDVSAELLSDSTIKIKVPCPEEWADLYGSWNMAFVSGFESMPYFTSILIVPSVSGYREWPCEEYMARRAYLLRNMLKYFSHLEEFERNHVSPLASITRQWGRVNKDSARHFENLVQQIYRVRNGGRDASAVTAGS